MNKAFLILVLTCISLFGTAADQLKNSFPSRKEAMLYIDSLNKVAYSKASSDIPVSKKISKHTLALSNAHKYSLGKIDAINNIAIANRCQGNYSHSLAYLKQSLRIAYEIDNPTAIGKCYYGLGDLHKTLWNYDRAMYYFHHAFYLFRQASEFELACLSLNNYAHCTMDKGIQASDTTLFHKAIKYYFGTIKIGMDNHLDQRIVIGHVNLANAYNVLGQHTNNSRHYSESIQHSKTSLAFARKYNFPGDIAISYNNIGEVMESQGKTDSALYYYHKAFEVYAQLGQSNWMVFSHIQMARQFVKKEMIDQAIRHVEWAIAISHQQNFKDNLQGSYALLADIYSAAGKHEEALRFYKLSGNYKDSISNEKNKLVRAGLQMEFEADQKDKEIILLNKDKELQGEKLRVETIYRNILIVGCSLLFLLLIFVWLRFREKQRTEIKILKAKEEAEKAKEVQEQFLTNTSHEIRTPMNGVMGMTELLLKSKLTPEQREYVDSIHESAGNLLVIINDLLDLSKIKAGKMTLVKKPFCLSALFRNLPLVLDNKIREKDIDFIVEVDERITQQLMGDPVRIQQVLLNLAGNAVKFTDSGEVFVWAEQISCKENHMVVRFSVKDTGTGIPAANLKSIFDSFSQLDAKTNRKYGGTGLGLTISKQLVEQMGGTIAVESTESLGSTFSFELEFEIATIEKNKTKQVLKNNLQGINVLVVDDNKINRQVAQLTLEQWSAGIYLAESGQQALDLLSSGVKIDLILMDITMPEMDGFETTNRIRKTLPEPVCKVPIVAMTASAITGDKDKCLTMGMNDYISKPFKPSELFELVKRNLPLHKLQEVNTEQSVNLDDLFDKADGNTGFLSDIFETYVNEMPGYLEELNEAFKNKDLKVIREQAHKMKSPTALFGAYELRDHLHVIEKTIEQSGVVEEMEERRILVNTLGMQSIAEVRKELEKVLQD